MTVVTAITLLEEPRLHRAWCAALRYATDGTDGTGGAGGTDVADVARATHLTFVTHVAAPVHDGLLLLGIVRENLLTPRKRPTLMANFRKIVAWREEIGAYELGGRRGARPPHRRAGATRVTCVTAAVREHWSSTAYCSRRMQRPLHTVQGGTPTRSGHGTRGDPLPCNRLGAGAVALSALLPAPHCEPEANGFSRTLRTHVTRRRPPCTPHTSYTATAFVAPMSTPTYLDSRRAVVPWRSSACALLRRPSSSKPLQPLQSALH